MSSEQQITANRRNARLSTGPRTPAARARVSLNAVKHGLTGQEVVLPNEDPDEFESLRTGLLADLAPEGDLENALAERIVASSWRLRRVPILEAALYRRGFQEQIAKQAAQASEQYETTESQRRLASLIKKEVAPRDREAYAQAEQRLATERAALDKPSFSITRVLETYGGTFTNLWRHELAISRSFYQTLHELQRLQAARAGQHVAPPAVVDVDINLPDPPLPVGGADQSDATRNRSDVSPV
jgi:hypothetical protein